MCLQRRLSKTLNTHTGGMPPSRSSLPVKIYQKQNHYFSTLVIDITDFSTTPSEWVNSNVFIHCII